MNLVLRIYFKFLFSIALCCNSIAYSQTIMEYPPLLIDLSWDGDACNSGGFVTAKIKNISNRVMLLPKGVGYGFGALLIRRARSGDDASTTLEVQHSVPYDWAHLKEAAIKLRPGQFSSYKMRFSDEIAEKPFDHQSDKLSNVYAKVIREGGVISILYGLSDGGPGGWRGDGFFYADPKFYTLIPSNNLKCTKAH